MNMKRIYRYMGWLALPVALAACQDENGLSSVNTADGPYVLSASMPQQAQGRVFFDPAEIPGDEVLYWNEKDQFQLFQPTADGSIPEPNVFTISESYQESEKLRSADFTGQHKLSIGSSYYAFYPSALLNEEGRFELNMGDAWLQVDDMAAYEEYLRTHLFMKAKGVVKENTVLHFEPLYATVKIHYTNHTDEVQNIKRFGMDNRNGGYLWGIKKTYDTRFGDEWDRSVASTRRVEFVTTPVEVLPNASQDFYMVFFPHDNFVPGGEIVVAIQTLKQYLLITLSGLDVMEISRQNGGASSFEAGKVYQFNVSQTNRGLEWNRDMDKVLIMNDKMLSAIENNAQVKFVRLTSGAIDVEANSNVINSITQLDLSGAGLTSLEGIEYFTALESLRCEENSLDRLDVSALTNLKTLKCSNQREQWNTERVKSLALVLSDAQYKLWTDLWQSENGYGIYVNGRDKLKPDLVDILKESVDLTIEEDGYADCAINKNAIFSCTHLFIGDKSINSLEGIAYFQNLRVLHCYNCGLESLDVSNLSKLEELKCHKNKLTLLDVSKNAALTTLACGLQGNSESDILKLLLSEGQSDWWTKQVESQDYINSRVNAIVENNGDEESQAPADNE